MAARRSKVDELMQVRARVTELEARVRWLEQQLKKVRRAAKLPPPVQQGSKRPRCPGCFAEVPRGQRDPHCLYCGFDFTVVKPYRPTQRR